MPISKKFLERAAEALPRCRTLSDAEGLLGGEFRDNARDRKAAAVVWGVFDAWHGRPQTTGGVAKEHERDYLEAFEAARRISLLEQPA